MPVILYGVVASSRLHKACVPDIDMSILMFFCNLRDHEVVLREAVLGHALTILAIYSNLLTHPDRYPCRRLLAINVGSKMLPVVPYLHSFWST
jgi:hypothetical protein